MLERSGTKVNIWLWRSKGLSSFICLPDTIPCFLFMFGQLGSIVNYTLKGEKAFGSLVKYWKKCTFADKSALFPVYKQRSNIF